jgi:Ser/Thr protein kinase RdoA (MazF antagonist)
MSKKMPTRVLRQAGERYGLTTHDLKLLSSSESGNTVYQYQVDNKEFVLKLIPHANKDKMVIKNSLESELDLINCLADNGVNTSRAVISKGGNYVELIDLDSNTFFSAVSLEKARGREITGRDFGAELFTEMGRLTGRIHALTKQYKPGKNVLKRPEWYEDEYLAIDQLLPSTDRQLIEKSRELVNSLKNLPRNPDSYGLVHGDLQEHNLYFDNGALTVLDFENCLYCWYMLDFVASLEAIIGGMEFGEEMEKATIYFSGNYWQGYKQENQLDLLYFQKIPEFFKLWELLLYSEFINEWDMANLTEARKRLLNNYRADIIHGNRFNQIEFQRFYYA